MSHYLTKLIPDEKPAASFVQRPWGSFKQYAFNQETTVSLMTVEPGMRLSLQSHTARAELWIVLDPGGVVQVGDDIFYPQPGEEIWIPANTRHRLASLGAPVRVLEVAFGNWQQADTSCMSTPPPPRAGRSRALSAYGSGRMSSKLWVTSAGSDSGPRGSPRRNRRGSLARRPTSSRN